MSNVQVPSSGSCERDPAGVQVGFRREQATSIIILMRRGVLKKLLFRTANIPTEVQQTGQ